MRVWKRKGTTEAYDSGSRVWLEKFDTAIEAAKAYDRAVFRLRGSKAILKFPLEAGKSETAPVAKERKRRREVEEEKEKKKMVVVKKERVHGDIRHGRHKLYEGNTVDAVELDDGIG